MSETTPYVDPKDLKIVAAKRPKFGRGTTLDIAPIKTPDGLVDGYYDSTWGKFVYFTYRGVSLKVSMWHPRVMNVSLNGPMDLTEALEARRTRARAGSRQPVKNSSEKA